MSFSQDTQPQNGYQEINRTNKFDKSQTDPIPGMLGDVVAPETPKDHYLKSEKFKHLSQIQQEFVRNYIP